MKAIIIYKSVTGHTKEYAEMLSSSLGCEAIPLNQMSKANVEDYDTLIYGGCVHASKIVGLRSFTKQLSKKANQQVIVYAVGANGNSEENTAALISKNMAANNISYPFFYLQGGFDPDKLNFALRHMLRGVAKSLKKKQASDPDALSQSDLDFLEFFQDKHSNMDSAQLQALADYIQQSNPIDK